MRHLQQYLRKKFRTIRKKIVLFRKKSFRHDDQHEQQQVLSPPLPPNNTSFEHLGFHECERLPPSSNQYLLVYDVFSLEHQTVELMLEGFRRGYTPMDLYNDPHGLKIFWIELMWRGQVPLYTDDHGGFHIPKRLKQTLNNHRFHITVDRDFRGTIGNCASITGENRRDRSWINPEIRRLMIELHERGYAHSIEVWQDNKLVGGLYGVSLGGYFTIESQFSIVKDASKIALVHLVARLRLGGYTVLDIDEITSHLVQFGAYEIDRNEFLQRMKFAMSNRAIWLGNDISSDLIREEIQQLVDVKSS